MSPLGGFRETGSLPLFSPRRALFSPRRAHLLTTAKGSGISYGKRALCEADAASAEASRQCNSTCGCCCHRLRRRQNTTTDVLVRWVTIRNPPAACLLQTQPRTILRICSGSFAADRASLEATPYSFCEKETKSQSAERWCHGSLPHLRARTQRV